MAKCTCWIDQGTPDARPWAECGICGGSGEMEAPYTSSIIFKYGDNERVRQDAKALNDIIARQGNALLLDVIAENIGQLVLKYKMDVKSLKQSLLMDLSDAINERT